MLWQVSDCPSALLLRVCVCGTGGAAADLCQGQVNHNPCARLSAEQLSRMAANRAQAVERKKLKTTHQPER